MPRKKKEETQVSNDNIGDSAIPDHVGRFKNRIKELRYVAATDLHGHPKNWRTHPSEPRSTDAPR